MWLRHFTVHDAEFILQLVNSPGWLQFIGNIHVTSQNEAIDYITGGPLKSYEANGFGSYLIQLKKEKAPIGICSLIKRDWLNYPDLGYALLPGYEGHGYAYEAAYMCRSEMYSNNHADVMSAIVSPGNEASIKLLKKLNFVLDGTILNPESSEELLHFIHHKKIKN